MPQSPRAGHSSPLPQQSVQSDGPSARLWSVYVAEADRQDRALAHSWKGNMDALLIFAGLFSASITAFLIESYKSLTPDPNLIILGHISLQLAALANGTHRVQPDPEPVPFEPPVASLLCNVFWFLSLAFSLAGALAATLVEQWTRNYLTAVQKHPAPQIRARVRAYLYQGLQQFGMSTVVETIPTLLHISLFLFLAGLVAFLSPINSLICSLCAAILVVCTTLYAVVTLLPAFFHQCPYRTPFTSLCWRVWQAVSSYHYGFETPLTMSDARELSAVARRPARDERDKEALCRTVRSLLDGGEFAAFIEGIPGFLIDDFSGADIMKHILRDTDLNLGLRIVETLHISHSQQLHVLGQVNGAKVEKPWCRTTLGKP
ncbi:hypothetical protein C0993_006965 [Termitomyces sp. T159_Od127]|nr:hypothetical protein C0993_006965 [Termitomyces sp. T159_Od127]